MMNNSDGRNLKAIMGGEKKGDKTIVAYLGYKSLVSKVKMFSLTIQINPNGCLVQM